MERSVLELPKDVLRDIWHYLSLPDVIRFGMTAKNMFDSTWPYYQILQTERDWPIGVDIFVLSQDLSHIRELELFYAPNDRRLEKDRQKILQLYDLVAATSLPNLRSLKIDLIFPSTICDNMTAVNELIRTHTHLQSLVWYSAEVEEDFNVGQFFKNYTRLTSLTIETTKRLRGFNELTQLKRLDCSFSGQMDDASFSEVVELPHLKTLDVRLRKLISDESFTKITKLTELEELDINCDAGIPSLTPLLKLPSLKSLMYGSMGLPLVSVIGQLYSLTSLRIDLFSSRQHLDFNLLTGLTNLLELDIECATTAANFATFTKLTKLIWQNRGTQPRMSNLPPNLETFSINRLFVGENAIQEICSLEKLKELKFRYVEFNPGIMAHWITRLTHLTDITMVPSIPQELIRALEKLPNLVFLSCRDIPANSIEDLAKLTQLMELSYWNGYNRGLQAKFPFRVVFVGDLTADEQ